MVSASRCLRASATPCPRTRTRVSRWVSPTERLSCSRRTTSKTLGIVEEAPTARRYWLHSHDTTIVNASIHVTVFPSGDAREHVAAAEPRRLSHAARDHQPQPRPLQQRHGWPVRLVARPPPQVGLLGRRRHHPASTACSSYAAACLIQVQVARPPSTSQVSPSACRRRSARRSNVTLSALMTFLYASALEDTTRRMGEGVSTRVIDREQKMVPLSIPSSLEGVICVPCGAAGGLGVEGQADADTIHFIAVRDRPADSPPPFPRSHRTSATSGVCRGGDPGPIGSGGRGAAPGRRRLLLGHLPRAAPEQARRSRRSR